MAAYVAGRLVRALPLLFGLSILIFALVHAAPGGRPVLERVLERAGGTLELMGSAFALALVAALVLGTLAALRTGSLIDSLVSGASIVGISLPTFWLGPVLQLVFAVELRFLPTAGRMGVAGEGRLACLLLPAGTPAA